MVKRKLVKDGLRGTETLVRSQQPLYGKRSIIEFQADGA